jgi:hypothetical protein
VSIEIPAETAMGTCRHKENAGIWFSPGTMVMLMSLVSHES